MTPHLPTPTIGTDASGPDLANRVRRTAAALTSNWVFLALVILVLAFSVQAGATFFNVDNFRNILFNASGTMLLAVGTAYLIIGGQLDLSVGSVLVFSQVIAAKVIVAVSGSATDGYPNAGAAIALGLVVAVAVGAAWGLFNGILVTRLKIPSFIITLGTLGMGLGLAQVITKGTDVTGLPPQMVTSIGMRQVLGLPLPVWIAGIIAVVAGLILARTQFGRYTYAIGSNPEGARRSGIKVTRHQIVLFTFMGALAGLAGVLDVARFTTSAVSGHSADNLVAIAAVIIGGASLFGGRGTVFGTAVGVMIPAVLNNGLVIVNVQPFWQTVAIGAILIIAVAVDDIKRRKQLRAS
ncbi:ABC transporter permease [Streptomyces sp. NBC_00250]|uniref:ABC transporter permease n=1 Tax=Streptomyces sp. NBC_00250 TaxID=2903641 RepID=UPI002E2B2969|nr:ABC transporter permease [Streptomyces sp. NBC_00250]